MTNVVSMMEIDVLQVTELFEASDLTVKNSLPAMVVHPGLAADALMSRIRLKGRYKIIIPIDCPKGDLVGVSKFRGVSKETLEADGFEIAFSVGNRSVDELAKDLESTRPMVLDQSFPDSRNCSSAGTALATIHLNHAASNLLVSQY